MIGVMKHDEPCRSPPSTWQTREKGETKAVYDFARRANARVKGFPEERKTDTEDDSESKTEERRALRPRLNLLSSVSPLDDECLRRLECLDRAQPFFVLDQGLIHGPFRHA